MKNKKGFVFDKVIWWFILLVLLAFFIFWYMKLRQTGEGLLSGFLK